MPSTPDIPQTNHLESDLVELYRLNTEYDGIQVRYREHPLGQMVETWTVHEDLGCGAYSIVRKHKEEGTGKVRAVKSIEKRGYPFHAREFNIMAILGKPENRSLFVEFLGWFEDRDRLYITMEYFEQGDLRKHLEKPFSEGDVRIITEQVLKGLQVMHENEIAHRDLKPDNIFVVSMSPILVKLGDFGISKRIHSDTAYRSRVCTDNYAAPEVLGIDSTSESSVYTNAVDMWSLGCVVYELLVGTRLFCSLGDIIGYYYKKGDLLTEKLNKLATPINEPVKWLIRALVSREPEGRPSAVKAASHVWLGGHAIDGRGVGDYTSPAPSGTRSGPGEHITPADWYRTLFDNSLSNGQYISTNYVTRSPSFSNTPHSHPLPPKKSFQPIDRLYYPVIGSAIDPQRAFQGAARPPKRPGSPMPWRRVVRNAGSAHEIYFNDPDYGREPVRPAPIEDPHSPSDRDYEVP